MKKAIVSLSVNELIQSEFCTCARAVIKGYSPAPECDPWLLSSEKRRQRNPREEIPVCFSTSLL